MFSRRVIAAGVFIIGLAAALALYLNQQTNLASAVGMIFTAISLVLVIWPPSRQQVSQEGDQNDPNDNSIDIAFTSQSLTNVYLFENRQLKEAGTVDLIINADIQNKASLPVKLDFEVKDIDTDFLPRKPDVTELEFIRRDNRGENRIPVTLEGNEVIRNVTFRVRVKVMIAPIENTLPHVLKDRRFRMTLHVRPLNSPLKPIDYPIEFNSFGRELEEKLVTQITTHLTHDIAGAHEQIRYLRLLWKGE